MKIASIKTALAVVAMAGAAVAAQAQELKIGYVNSDRVLRESNMAKAAQARFDSEFGKRDKELTDAGVRLKAAADKFDKEAPTLSESERNRRQRELVEQDRELQRKRRELQEDANQRRNEEFAAIAERANRVIRQIYDSERYDLIIENAFVDATGKPMASARVDITKKVIDALNAGK